MKITISKSQWEEIGKTAGWTKTAQEVCPQCKGKKLVIEKIKNLGTGDYRDSTEPCPMCNGKGYLTEKDHEEYRHRVGIGPHPNS